MSLHRLSAFTLTLACLATSLRTAQGQTFVELSRYLPPDANAVVVVNATAMYDSPLGKKEDWRQKFSDASMSSPLMLPPTAERAVIGSELDIATLRPDWEAAVMTVSVDPTVQQVAEKHHGMVDDIGSIGAVWLPGDIVAVKFGTNLFGLLTNANRQEATRWVTSATDKRVDPLSPYLEQSVGYADSVGTQMILAVDLEGALRATTIRSAIANSPILSKLPADETAKLFTGLQGVKFGVIVTDKLVGKLQIDFADDASSLAPVAKPLILAMVGGAGAMLDEFSDWKAEVKGKSLSLEGELTQVGLRRIFSLLSLDASVIHGDDPAVVAATLPAQKKTPLTPEQLTAQASQRYFKAVDKYVQDSKNLNRANSLQQAALWLNNFARRIENLSTRNVDPDLVKFGKYVSQTFRYVVDQAYGIEDQLAQQQQPEQPVTYQEAYVPTLNYINWGGYIMPQYAPYYSATYDTREYSHMQQKTADEIAKMTQEAQKTLAELQSNTEKVRQSLVEKFKLKF